mmetsp:Transcript_13753/g.19664  ORF Transcript_13753/g.19664 Transcript_13753/m.19664 type:complete len:127 (+) Transcript_13753:135-515(+)|eukprot:CAMPEP_0184871908 /NCGR_PEP_ID=MMETSP0580-20130426/40986_1 /TAXON_ID=1118495 /ORGANISM="Dactyliosolen fragilissimus" /LENGTH=126 /DNA_ID=CAMNT_0027374627 /DNA_START=417 /DNA_END=797 /DNA_ORIENTATION=-
MNQFVQRIANYIANEILIKGLANSKTFQRFAVRTDATLQKLKKESNERINSTLDEIHKSATREAFSTKSGSNSGRRPPGSGRGFHTISNVAAHGHGYGRLIQPSISMKRYAEAFVKEIRKELRIGK